MEKKQVCLIVSLLLIVVNVNAQYFKEEVKRSFQAKVGIGVGLQLPQNELSFNKDSLANGFASGGISGNLLNVTIQPYQKRIGLNVRYHRSKLPFDANNLFKLFEDKYVSLDFDARAESWKIGSFSGSLTYSIPIFDAAVEVEVGAGAGAHFITRPKVVANYEYIFSIRNGVYSYEPWTMVQYEAKQTVVSFNAMINARVKVYKGLDLLLSMDYQRSSVEMEILNEYDTIYISNVIYYNYWQIAHRVDLINLTLGLSYRI